jgi:vacuolar-type H+-ATPase subunit I/STV1
MNLKDEPEKERQERDQLNKPATPVSSEVDIIDKQTLKVEAETRQELARRNLTSFKEWDELKKKEQAEISKQQQDVADRESKLKESEVELIGKQGQLDTEANKNQEWATKLERAETGLKKQVGDFLVVKGKDKELLRADIEQVMKFLCIPLVENTYGDGYVQECVDNIIGHSVKIVASILDVRCKVKPLYDDNGSYIDSETRKRLGFKDDGTRYQDF